MPLIEVRVIENMFNSEQKSEMIRKLTDAMVLIEGENMRCVTRGKISEVASGDWGIGGQRPTTEAVKDLAAGRKVACRAAPCIASGIVLPAVRRGASLPHFDRSRSRVRYSSPLGGRAEAC